MSLADLPDKCGACGHGSATHVGRCFVNACHCREYVGTETVPAEAEPDFGVGVIYKGWTGFGPPPDTAESPFAPPDEEETAFQIREDYPVAMVFRSRHGGAPHVVSLIDDPREARLQCTCRATLSGRECWATHVTRGMLGLPEPVKEAKA